MSNSMGSDTITSTISSLLESGRNIRFAPDRCRYVCHTSTIPLSRTVDEQFILSGFSSQDRLAEVTHSTKYVENDLQDLLTYRCCKVHCMYVHADGKKSSPEILRDNCPCAGVCQVEYTSDGQEVERFLQPLCFLQVVKESRYSFGYTDASGDCESDEECCHNELREEKRLSNRPRIDFAEVMFCQNSQGVTDERWSRPMREHMGISGWRDVRDPKLLVRALNTCYWFRKYISSGLKGRISSPGAIALRKTYIEQVLYTLDGLLTKLFICFPCEMQGYTKLAKATARLFEALYNDYDRPQDWDREATAANSPMLELKEKFKFVKENLHSGNYENRIACITQFADVEQRNGVSAFFAATMRRLLRRIGSLDLDYTQSLGWLNSMTGLSQSRNLGYLPDWIAHKKRAEFRANISREPVHVSKVHMEAAKTILWQRQSEMGIPQQILRRDFMDHAIFRDAISRIEIALKRSASVHSTVSAGGKVEDARLLLNAAMENHWRVPRRNFETGVVDGWIEFTPATGGGSPPYEDYVYWLSLQICVNFLARTSARFKPFARELKNSEAFEDEIGQMKIVHISEPAKERNLTKSSALMTWVLTVTSKVSQTVLSYSQDHRAGLVLSAQDWMHQRRVSSLGQESWFMYDPDTGLRYSDIWNGFQDWTESTDFIPRRLGGAALAAWLAYIGFPKWLSQVTIALVLLEFEVEEISSLRIDGKWYRETYKTRVSEGFMMGNPMTKTILHLMHDVNIGTVHNLLHRVGINVATYAEINKGSRRGLTQPSEFRIHPANVPEEL